ncbi:cupredoxin domain-containing protein [Alicyclobacillus curvatus]|nr:cupredoxin domain-containing protein [Alicyclobacillus curvatus]
MEGDARKRGSKPNGRRHEQTGAKQVEGDASKLEGERKRMKVEKRGMKIETRGMKGEKMKGEILNGEKMKGDILNGEKTNGKTVKGEKTNGKTVQGEKIKAGKIKGGLWMGLTLCVLAGAVLTPSTAYAGSRKVNVQLTDNGFTPSNILAVVDQPIEIHVVNTGHRDHQFSIPYYRIYSRDLSPGATTDIAFSPWTAGHFDVMSDPSGNNHAEFRGQFIVAGNPS